MGRWLRALRGELIARRLLALRGATEESCEFRTRRRPLGLGPSSGEPRCSLRAVGVDGASLSAGGSVAPCVAVVGARMAASDPS